MKIKNLAAIAVAVVLVAFVVLRILPKTQAQPSFNIVGRWKIDTAYVKDTSLVPKLFRNALMGSGENEFFRFMNDSAAAYLSPKDSTSFLYYLKDSTLYINHGDGFNANRITFLQNDSIRYVSATDSIVYILSRK